MGKKVSVGAAIMMMAMTAAVAVTVTIVIMMRVFNAGMADFSQRSSMFSKLAGVDALVRENYIGKIDEKTLDNSIIQGYMKGVGDKYGTYLDAEDYSRMNLENEGKASGIGVNVIENSDGYIKVVSVLSGSPAESAGIKADDIIVKISGEDVKALGYAGAVNLMRGDVGTTVELTLSRAEISMTLSVTRKTYETQTVQSHMIGDIGYIKILEFDGNTASQFSKAVDSMTAKGAKGLVFDVRNNPGGLLDQAEKVLDKLLPAGTVVRQKDKSGKITPIYTSDASSVNLPMAVLTNQNTASAAELFTAALKDYNKAKSVGTKTYGKGTMQRIIDLHDGTALDLSVAYFYPPKSDNFEGKGVMPDIESTLSDEKLSQFYTLSESQDDQLQAGLKYLDSVIK